jgi:chemosensory pili system protein ChpA (sensor histidine kinase/response regulator)
MATTSKPSSVNLDVGVNDLGPLAWVLDELRKSLDNATKALKRFVRDAEAARGSDLSAVDASQLRIARQQLHQSVGALEMVGFAAPASMLRGMEAAVQKFVAKPELCSEEASNKVERASFALLGYLEALLLNKAPSAVELFSQYADVQELAGASRTHPADLWAVPWRWKEVADTGVAARELDASFRAKFDKTALMVVKTADAAACGELCEMSAALANQTAIAVDVNFRSFWRIAAGVFEAVHSGSLVADVHVKRTVSRLLIQLATHIKGDMSVPDRLAQDLVFFCAQSTPKGMTPCLGEVRMVYGLAAYRPVDYTKSFYGQFDPTILVQARKRIGQLKESWSSFTAGEISKAKPVQDQMSLMIDSIHKLMPEAGQDLSQAFNKVLDSTAKIGKAPEAALGMEVATSILYVEASFEDFDPTDDQTKTRMTRLAERVEQARAGGVSQPLESWMEELYRKVSDRQTMGSVVGELKINLGELEKLMDAYFRDPQDKLLLSDVPSKLMQMRGVLTVLGLDHATQAVGRMRDTVEHIMMNELDVEKMRAAGTFDKLGNNLGALGFLIDMLSYQPVLAKKLFAYDEVEGELKPLMGRTVEAEEPQEAVSPVAVPDATSGVSVAPAAVATTAAVLAAVPASEAATPASTPVTASGPVIVDAAEVDPELLDIFLEEAREVATNGLAAVQALKVEPNNIGEMTTLRRAFHTLKGSSRMVGLNVFGESAWSMEQVMNSWLAEQKPANEMLCSLSIQALQAQQTWIEEIARGEGKQRSASPFRASADALRLEGKLVPIDLSISATAPVTVSEPLPEPTPENVSAPLALEVPAVVATAVTAAVAGTALASASAPAPALEIPELNFEALLPQAPEQPPQVEPLAAAITVTPAEPASEISFDIADFELPQESVSIPTSTAPVADSAPAAAAGAETASLLEPVVELPSSFAEFFPADPVVTIATPVAPAPMVSVAAPVSLNEATPLSMTGASALAAGAGLLAAGAEFATPADTESGATAVTAEPSASRVEIVDTPVNIEASLDAAAAQDETLVTDEEMAAFERAMLEMDNAAGLAASEPMLPEAAAADADHVEIEFDLSQSPQAVQVQVEPEPVVQVQSLDVDALQNLSEMFKEPEPAASAASTQPAAFAPTSMNNISSLQEPADLGIDLGAGLAAGAAVGVVGAMSAAAGLASSAADNSRAGSFNAVLPSQEDQVKAIGPLRVSLPLYNVYLNEADEWSRRLSTVLGEWAYDGKTLIPNDSIAFAHSLAGSSATVGFGALSGLARALEHGLTHLQRIEEDGAYNSHRHASVLTSAAENIRHLLHQFAAGILKEPMEGLEDKLAQLMHAPLPEDATAVAPLASGFVNLEQKTEAAVENINSSAMEIVANDVPATSEPVVQALPLQESAHTQEPTITLPEAEPSSSSSWATVSAATTGFAGLAAVAAVAASSSTSSPSTAANTAATVSKPELASNVVSISTAKPLVTAELAAAPVLAVRARQVSQDELQDEIDAQDAIDPDLFEIFDEEAQELFPMSAAALRQWTASPGDMNARGELLRGLHTIKGSARLAGAMRLGEMAHRMESSVEEIPHEGANAADIDALMAQLDGMQHTMDVLRNPALAQEAPFSRAVAPGLEQKTAHAGEKITQSATNTVAPTTLRAFSAPQAQVAATRSAQGQTVRVRAQLLDRLMNQAGEVMITRTRLEAELSQLRGSLSDLQGNLDKLRTQLRELDVQAESQMQTRIAQTKDTEESFDPLEFDRYTRVQELTRMMAESVNDVATVQRNIQRTIESTEDDLIAQARQTRELQRDLLRTRMVEFEGISERLYRVVRQAGKDAGKQVKLDILGGTIEMDRGVLDRMTPAFEHLLRNCVAHGIETAEARTAAGKAASGEIIITLHQEGNDVSLEFRDDGAGLNVARIREKAVAQGLLSHDANLGDNDAANLIFTPGFSTAATVTELSGRGVGMDVVRSEVVALGGRIETATEAGKGTSFKLVLPLTTAVTQVVMIRIGSMSFGVPANVVEIVRRATQKELQQAYNSGGYEFAGETLPFYWAGALMQHSPSSVEPATKTLPIAIFRSAAQRVAVHVDEVLGSQEVVVKNLGPQLSRLPGLAGMTVMASGAVTLIYNPVALATVYGQQARAMSFDPAQPHALEDQAQITDVQPRELADGAAPVVPLVPANPASISPPAVPLVLVVDDSITVRRVTQRLLQREGYRVAMAADGLQGLERLAEELPSVILSDIEMPRMDGFDFLRNVRATDSYKHLPTIMITSRIADKHREHAMELGANHYLGKPYNEEELLSLIRRYSYEQAEA